jgi:2-succinyl-5-enolpyruvyl-6-hydroxy-3-cyclohexene-1-carboxylate synthase
MKNSGLTTMWCRAFMDELARLGVGNITLAPGSRSTPLVMACARDDRFKMWTH